MVLVSRNIAFWDLSVHSFRGFLASHTSRWDSLLIFYLDSFSLELDHDISSSACLLLNSTRCLASSSIILYNSKVASIVFSSSTSSTFLFRSFYCCLFISYAILHLDISPLSWSYSIAVLKKEHVKIYSNPKGYRKNRKNHMEHM